MFAVVLEKVSIIQVFQHILQPGAFPTFKKFWPRTLMVLPLTHQKTMSLFKLEISFSTVYVRHRRNEQQECTCLNSLLIHTSANTSCNSTYLP